MNKLFALAFGVSLLLPVAASAQPYGGFHGPHPRFHRGGFIHTTARVSNVNGSAITLDNGHTVFLKGKTSINGRLHPGALIDITGTAADNYNINAQKISVLRRH